MSKEYDLIYASSSRLMTAALGSLLSRTKKSLLYLDIRDLFFDTSKELFSGMLLWIIAPLLQILERWTFKKANKINLVSGGLKEYFNSNYPKLNLSFYSNGIDSEFLSSKVDLSHINNSKIPTILYAGNIGEGQGLNHILPGLCQHFEDRLKFKIIGDGGRKDLLESELKLKNVQNFELCKPLGRKELITEYEKAEVLFLHLNNYDAFLKVLPSKIFEYGAMGKPIWAGVAGYPARFLTDNVSNVAVFDPCDLNQAIESFEQLILKFTPRKNLHKNFCESV